MSPSGPQKRIDELCDQYEQALRSNQPFDLQDCLNQIPPADQPELLAELIHLEQQLLAAVTEKRRTDANRIGLAIRHQVPNEGSER
jgi:hypothetical protein